MRVVIDTNLIVSGFIWGGTPLLLFRSIVEKMSQIEILTTQSLLDELKEVLSRSKFIKMLNESGDSADNIIHFYQESTKQVEPAIIPPNVIRDPNDIKFLACAVGGQADYIITGDNDLLILKEYQEIRIVTASEFLTIIQKG